ncbi:uncharacterized protein LOC144658989 isoform X2 [Oculina patagonica]
MQMKMRTSLFLVFCVLSCFCSKFIVCDVAGQEGTNLNTLQFLDIDVRMDHEILTPKETFITNQPGAQNPSRYSVGLHFRSLNLMLTLNVTVARCETHNRTGIETGKTQYGKILTKKDGIQISLDYNSSVDSSADTSTTSTALHWITWPFKSLGNKMAIVYNFWADKTMKVLHWIAWPFRILTDKFVVAYDFLADVCSSLKEKVKKQFDDPIKIIEAVLEVIWMVVSPFVRAVIWLCENIIDAKRYVKMFFNLKTALFLEEYPAVLGYITTCKMIGEHLSKFLSLWPWNWMDSIEYIGFTWVILYFSFTLIKFAMMNERQMLRMARRTGKNRH